MDNYTLSVYSSLALMVIGVGFYIAITVRAQDKLKRKEIWPAVADVVSHIPDNTSSALPHVAGSLCFIIGITMLASTAIADMTSPKVDYFGQILPLTGFFSAVMFSGVSLWTLWQTRRLAFERGYVIADFSELIAKLGEELRQQSQTFQDNNYRLDPDHRVFLVTTQPLLGSISLHNRHETREFHSTFRTILGWAGGNDELGVTEIEKFPFGIICGTVEAIEKFHLEAISKGILNAEKSAQILNAVEEFLAKCPKEKLIRTEEIPPVQFMIVGNKVFEFTLEVGNSGSNIYNTQVINDARYADQYQKTFIIFSKLINRQRNERNESTAIPTQNQPPTV